MANTNSKRFTPIGGGTTGHSYFTVSSNEDADRFECECGHASFFRDDIAKHQTAAKAAASTEAAS